MRNRSLAASVATAALTLLLSLPSSEAQAPAGARGAAPVAGRGARGNAPPAAPSKPTPHWPDGRVNLSQAPGIKGFWNVAGGSPIGKGGSGLPTNLTLEEVPFQDGARALYAYRQT